MIHPAADRLAATLAQARPPARSADWQRELQQARQLAWFPGPLEARAAAQDGAFGSGDPCGVAVAADAADASAAPGPATAAVRRGPASPRPALHAAALPVGTTAVAPVATGSDGLAAAAAGGDPRATGTSPVVAPCIGAGPPAVTSAPARIAGAAPVPLPARPQRADPGPAIRIHLEQGPQGLVVWLGMDGDAAGRTAPAAAAAAVVAELRRTLAAAGQPLTAVICNGSTIAEGAGTGTRSRSPAPGRGPLSFQSQEP